jgi:hypothetical protein
MNSCSDNEAYPSVCLQAATDDTAFATFKQNPHYNQILEHVDFGTGAEYLKHFINDDNFLQHIEKFKINDSLGGPRMYDYPIGTFSPTTFRYIKILKDLSQLELNDIDIVEIGAGYGGQYVIMRQMYKPKKYTFIDMPETLQLIKRYVTALKLDDIELEYIDFSKVQETKSDLVISNYAISECIEPVQDLYIEKIIKPSKQVYMIYNNLKGYKHEEFVNRCGRNIKITTEAPLTCHWNVLLTY